MNQYRLLAALAATTCFASPAWAVTNTTVIITQNQEEVPESRISLFNTATGAQVKREDDNGEGALFRLDGGTYQVMVDNKPVETFAVTGTGSRTIRVRMPSDGPPHSLPPSRASIFGGTRTGPYIGLGAGAAFAQGSSPATIGGTGLEHETGYNIGGIVGYDFGKFRAEAEVDYKRFRSTQYRLAPPVVFGGPVTGGSVLSGPFFDSPKIELPRIDTPQIAVPPSESPIGFGDTSMVSFMLNGMLDFGDDDGLQGFVGGGAGVARVNHHLSINRSGPGIVDDTDTSFAWQAIAGIRAPINDRINVGIRFKYSRSARETIGPFEVSSTGSLIATIEIDLDDLDTPKSESDHFPVAPAPLPPEEGHPTDQVM